MQWLLFLLILMGQCVFFVCQLYEYKFVKETKTWTEAQQYCRENFTDLATVYDMTDMKKLRRYLRGNEDKEAWIGLYNEQNGTDSLKWHWSLPGVEHHENQSKWDANERTGTIESCARIVKHKLQDIKCCKKHYFICYDERNTTNKFHLIKENKTWPWAQRYCRRNHTDLVSGLDQLEDQELISKLDKDPEKDKPWTIGLFRDTWRWSDGSSFSFRRWDRMCTQRPDGRRCVMTRLNKTHKWEHSASCNEKKTFFCYEDKVILIRQNKTWDEALDYCRENYNDLVSITNLKEQRWVQERVKNASTPFVWLGLRYTCTLEFWFWVSDETVTYKNWVSEGRDDDCNMSGAMERGGEYKWYKKDDAEKFNFICSKQNI